MFELDKKNALTKQDKSKKKHIDKSIKKLVNLINAKPNYYTTSSCSGRILLLSFPYNYKKYQCKWLFVSHDEVNLKQIKKVLKKCFFQALKNIPKKDIWFKEESTIMHIACKTLEDAQKLRDKASFVGFKRAGIIASRKKIVLELVSTENMDAPIVRNGILLVDDKYLRVLVQEANKKLRRTKKKIKKFISLM